jgi:hypothetical protein
LPPPETRELNAGELTLHIPPDGLVVMEVK